MKHAQKSRQAVLIWAALSIPVMWLALLIASCYEPGRSLSNLLSELAAALNNDPLHITWNAYSLKAVGVSLILYGFAITMYLSTRGNKRPGEEHGSAHWGDAKQVNAIYSSRSAGVGNVILTQNVQLGMDTYRHQHNLNIMVVGGSGSGKSRYYAMPNIMQASCSYIITDSKGELLRSLGPLFEAKGIPITVLNLVDIPLSDG